MALRRLVAIVASARSYCAVCKGDGEVQVRTVPVGEWVKARCPHCAPDAYLVGTNANAPILPLPWHQDTERNTA